MVLWAIAGRGAGAEQRLIRRAAERVAPRAPRLARALEWFAGKGRAWGAA